MAQQSCRRLGLVGQVSTFDPMLSRLAYSGLALPQKKSNLPAAAAAPDAPDADRCSTLLAAYVSATSLPAASCTSAGVTAWSPTPTPVLS